MQWIQNIEYASRRRRMIWPHFCVVARTPTTFYGVEADRIIMEHLVVVPFGLSFSGRKKLYSKVNDQSL